MFVRGKRSFAQCPEATTAGKRPAMAEANAPSPSARGEEAAKSIDAFANFLFEEEPDVFDSVIRAKRFLELADRRFRGRAGFRESFFDPCTQNAEQACWALDLHQRWNAFLNPRGIEMIAIHEGTFSFQTFKDAPNVLLGPDDVISMCACLWILRHHRCISKVALDMSVIARYHPAIFWRLLRFNTEYIEEVELKGLGDFNDCCNIDQLFNSTKLLSLLALTNFTLTATGVVELSDLVANNVDLSVLILNEIRLGAAEIRHLGRIISVNEHPWRLELRGSIEPSDGQSDAVANLLDTTLGELHLDVSCNWAPFFRRLGDNNNLLELEIVDRDAFLPLSMNDLASALSVNKTLKRLKLQMCVSSAEPSVVIGWQNLSRAIGKSPRLQLLSFAFSTFGEEADAAVTALGDALAENRTLQELSVEGCDLSCANLILLLDSLGRNAALQKLHIGALDDDDDLCEKVLGHITELNLSERVDWVCKLKSDRLLWAAIQEGKNAAPHGLQKLRKLILLRPRVGDVDDPFAGLSLMYSALTSLSIGGDVAISDAGAETLAHFFVRCSVLGAVALQFPASERQVVTMLSGLALSKTVSLLVVGGGWHLVGAASATFEHALRTNSSITELNIVESTRVGFEELKCHLQRGLQGNYSISKLRLLYGAKRVESCDGRIMRLLQCNRMLASWAADAIVESYITKVAAYALDRINACDSGRLILRNGTGYSDEELDITMPEVLKKVKEKLANPAVMLRQNQQTKTSAYVEAGTDHDLEELRKGLEFEHGPLCRTHPFTLQGGE